MSDIVELVTDRTKPIPFSHNGRELKARPMPLRLALKMEEPTKGGKVTVGVELMAECISACVLFADTGEKVFSADEILDGDVNAMVPLFREVASLFNEDDAAKN